VETERRKHNERILTHPKKHRLSNAQTKTIPQSIELSKIKKKRRKSPIKKTKRRFCKYWIPIEDEQKISLNNLKGITGEQMVLRWLTERRTVGKKCYGEYGLYQVKQRVGLNIPKNFIKHTTWEDYRNQTQKGVDISLEHPYKGEVAIEVKNWRPTSVGSGINEVKALLMAMKKGSKGVLIQTDPVALGMPVIDELKKRNCIIVNIGKQVRYGGKGATQTWHDAWIELEQSDLQKYLGIYNPQLKLQYDKKIREKFIEWINQRRKALNS
jgi:hypothetical protein